MDISDLRQTAQIHQCKELVTDNPYNNSNELDLTPQTDSSHCHCEVDEVPKVFPKRSRTARASRTQSSTTSSDPPKIIQCPGFFQKVMENARSILSMKCSNIHPTDMINEEPTKDVGSCNCESDDKQWQSATLTSKEMEYASLPSYECICDEESTRYDSSADSCSCSCSCQNSDENKEERATTGNNATRNNTYDIEGATKSDNNTYNMESDYKSSKSVKSYTCTCSNSRINTATYSIKNTSVKSCACGTSKAGIFDKMVQKTVENIDISCDCAVKMHSTGTKIYPMENIMLSLPQKGSMSEKKNVQRSSLSDKTVEVSQPMKNVTCETSERSVSKKKTDRKSVV